jgi:hypothetical protein
MCNLSTTTKSETIHHLDKWYQSIIEKLQGGMTFLASRTKKIEYGTQNTGTRSCEFSHQDYVSNQQIFLNNNIYNYFLKHT